MSRMSVYICTSILSWQVTRTITQNPITFEVSTAALLRMQVEVCRCVDWKRVTVGSKALQFFKICIYLPVDNACRILSVINKTFMFVTSYSSKIPHSMPFAQSLCVLPFNLHLNSFPINLQAGFVETCCSLMILALLISSFLIQ